MIWKVTGEVLGNKDAHSCFRRPRQFLSLTCLTTPDTLFQSRCYHRYRKCVTDLIWVNLPDRQRIRRLGCMKSSGENSPNFPDIRERRDETLRLSGGGRTFLANFVQWTVTWFNKKTAKGRDPDKWFTAVTTCSEETGNTLMANFMERLKTSQADSDVFRWDKLKCI